jgi:predicted GNAT superfamily acetyltransferase
MIAMMGTSDAAATAAGTEPTVEIRMLTSATEMQQVIEVFRQVWGTPTPAVPTEMLMAISHSGGYVAAAFDTDGQASGASVGILARHRGAPALHSHITGLLPGARHSGIGRALKLHQMDWARAQGIEWIVWTFDPLVRRNAWFNIAVLGAHVDAYLPSFYGPMTDAINAGDESDRLLVSWRVTAHADEARTAPLRDGSELGVGVEVTGAVPTPADVVALRRTDPDAVARWRADVRTALTRAFARGEAVIGFTRDGNYVLGRRRPTAAEEGER